MEGEGCNPGVAMESGNPLLKAVFLRRLRLTRLLLEGGAYINESDGQGQTPLMVACRTQHTDAQSASRVKLVQFLLEKGADPNIQDKEGRSALMHACRERASPEVVTLLLDNGADIGLEDQSGTSALVYAVTAGDWKVLKILMDTCKAKGKEVIIITTDQFPGGKLKAKQYLSMPPLGPLDQTASGAPASPSEIQLITSPQCPSSSSSSSSSSLHPPQSVFSFKESCGGVSSHPCSPSRFRGISQATASRLQQPLLRLNSEPWLKIPASLINQQTHVASDHQNHHQQHHHHQHHQTEDFSLRIPEQEVDDYKWYDGRLGIDKSAVGDRKNDLRGQKISLPGLLSSHSASHPNLHSETLGADPIASSSSKNLIGTPLHNLASSSLNSIIQRRKLGADIYGSDPQLAAVGIPEERGRGDPMEGRKLAPLRCSSTLGSRESLQSTRRVLAGLERRGSGAFLLDHSSQAKPRSLPPLTLNSSNVPVNVYNLNSSGVGTGKESGLKTFLPAAPPGHPKEMMTRRMLLRRHSMQTEQFKTTA